MKALPIWQPYASLVAVGAKRFETRHWPAPGFVLGRRVAIHACKTTRDLWFMENEACKRRLDEAMVAGTLHLVDGELPLGCLVATAVVLRSTVITEERAARLERESPDEAAFGNYDTLMETRYAWVLDEVVPFERPIPFRGAQGIFDVPDHVIASPPADQGVLA